MYTFKSKARHKTICSESTERGNIEKRATFQQFAFSYTPHFFSSQAKIDKDKKDFKRDAKKVNILKLTANNKLNAEEHCMCTEAHWKFEIFSKLR